ncbi:MAG: hypothetical protein A3F42_00760 [Gammaproteobacteria bacterium RIFCSPHIGHO2_12_FULL_37_34]|nr:MAG: hypothetical protein A3F42_00760 [Gammaproteobacteria bacterium RIFCSPHIGHO2_12_FULL_37_34]
MLYQVKKQYGRGSETIFAKFNDLTDANLFIKSKLAADLAVNEKVIYRIYEGVDLVEEFNSESSNLTAAQSSGSRSQSQASAAGFRPTPFNATPRPTGTPPKWVKENDEEEKK